MHKLLSNNPGQKMLLLGNEAIARGGIEAGVSVCTTYPGTPSSEISLNFFQMSQQADDLYFEYSANEKVALEVAAASANTGVRTMCIMKHVGLNVAADALMTLAYVGVTGGLVIITADDPAMFSSQNEQDNRYYGKISGLPVVEPSSIEEAKEMIKYAFDLSEKIKEPVLFRTTTRINHSNAFVTFGKIKQRKTKGEFKKDPFSYVTVPAVSRKLHVRLLENIKKAQELSEKSEYNFVKENGKLGIVSSGVSYNYASDAVKDLGIEKDVSILRIGFSNPLPRNKIKKFLEKCSKVLIVEEGEPFLEEAIKAIAQEEKIDILIAGKSDKLFSRLYEFDPAMVRDRIAKYFDISHSSLKPVDISDIPEIPMRPPNLCAGCSHRATYFEIKKAAEELNIETIYPADIGCYTLGFLPPLSMADFLICMGSSVGTSCGFSKTTDKKVVGFIGDSTFFHSGIAGLVNAVFNNHNFTLVILDNGTTAMTGHQPHPGVDMKQINLNGYNTISIENVVKGIGVPHVTVIHPYNVKKSVEAIKEALNFKGVSVVISSETCILYAKSLKKKRGKQFYINHDKCTNDRVCVNQLGCPAFFIKDEKVNIAPDMCAGCAVCAQICEENAIMPLPSK